MSQHLRRVEVTTCRTVRTYAYLFHAGCEALGHAEEDEKGRFYDCLASITFFALALEAFFNHLASQVVQYWEHFERKLGPPEKLELLAEALGIRIERDTRPFNDFKRLMWFRNFTAHGKTFTEETTERHKLLPEELTPTGETEWEKECTLANAKKYMESTRQMLEQLNRAAGGDDSSFLSIYSAAYCATDISRSKGH